MVSTAYNKVESLILFGEEFKLGQVLPVGLQELCVVPHQKFERLTHINAIYEAVQKMGVITLTVMWDKLNNGECILVEVLPKDKLFCVIKKLGKDSYCMFNVNMPTE